MPDLSESDRCIITDSFLQFQRHWLSNLNFSLGLLSKFLGDMEILIQDASLEVAHQYGRLLALFSCFSTVLQVTASGMLEMNLLEQICEPIENMTPRFLWFVSMFGIKFGWSKWVGVSWRCLVVLADILQEKFSNFYSVTIDILFQSLSEVSSSQLLDLLKNNMQLLSLQNLGLSSSAVQTLLQFESPLSQLRLHPNHHIVAKSAATYLFLLQHGSDCVVSQALSSLITELELLKGTLQKTRQLATDLNLFREECEMNDQIKPDLISCKCYSEMELISLFKFDLKMLLFSVSIGAAKSFPDKTKIDSIRHKRSTSLTSLILTKLDPFDFPIQGFLELQVHVIRTLHKLSEVEILTRLTGSEKSTMHAFDSFEDENQGSLAKKSVNSVLITEYLRKYNLCITRALDVSSPHGVKLEALNWLHNFGRIVVEMNKDWDLTSCSREPYADTNVSSDLLFSILETAYDREINVRSLVSYVLQVLLEARLIYPGHFCFISEVALDKLTDPDIPIRNAYVGVLSVALPLAIYTCSSDENRGWFCKLRTATTKYGYNLKWKQVLALKQLPQKLNSQQLVSILSYISQRWKVPLSSWVQRLVFNCLGKKEISASIHEAGGYNIDGILKDPEIEGAMLEKMCPVSNLAAIWWSIHEAARHCISLRLRTHLGGPTQTFAALERMLLDIPNVLLLDTEQTEGNYIGSSSFHLLPMQLLLEFVEALKKNVYNAYEGSSVLPCPTRQSSMFFRANKKVCEEWFSRICEPLMNAGFALHCHDATLHYCALRLQDLKTLVTSTKDKMHGAQENFHTLRPKLTADVLKILRHASLALCRSCEPQALLGLKKWVLMTFPFLFVDDNTVSQGLSAGCRHLSWMTGLVYQAEGHYEKAAAHFSHLLQSEEALSSLGSDGIQFVIARVIENYTSLSDWKSLEIWLTEIQALRSMHAGKTYSGALTAAGNELNAVHALACFDEGDTHAAWGYLDLTPKSSNELTLDPKIALDRSEQMLLRAMLQRDGRADKVLECLKGAKLMLEETLSAAPLDGLAEAAACAAQLHCIFAFEEGMRSNGLTEAKQVPSVISSFRQVLRSTISSHHQDCSLWIKILRVYRTVQPDSLVTPLLYEKVLNLARKQKNYSLADRMSKCLKDHLLRYSYIEHAEIISLSLQYENILLKHSGGKHEEALVDLWSLVCPSVLSPNICASEIGAALKAKACLKVSTWLRQEISDVSLRKVLHMICKDFAVSDAFDGSFTSGSFLLGDGKVTSVANCNVILEEIVGITTKVSCHLCPTLSKAWLSYASWCFNQAKGFLPVPGAILQSCSLSPLLNPEVLPDRFQLTEEEMSKVKSIITNICHCNRCALLKHDADQEPLDCSSHPKFEALVNSLVQQTVYLMQAAAGAPGLEESDGECPSSTLYSQLQVLFLCMDAGLTKSDIMPHVDGLVKVWWSLRKRRVSLLGHAAKGYFRYLSHSSSKLQDSYCASIHPDVTKEKATSCNLRAMLYILHILLNYGVELGETLELGFATVPLLPWQEITPQLFARLSSHPKETVRKQLEGLLMMLAKLSPWSIVYPLLVDINAYEGPPSEELKRILDCLGKLNKKLIQDVQLVVSCLGTITVLWEEQWLSTLQDLHTDVIRRINMLKEEAARIAENTTLSHTEKNKISAAKYSAMMAPIVVALERRLASTSREPETPHEIWFCKEYGQQLKTAILAFKTPPGSTTALCDVWRPFDTIAASLATSHRKSFIYLSEVAPQLALLSASDVPMPGLEKRISLLDSSGTSTADVQGIVTVSSFCEQVTVLSTKTKPKKLVLLGSDGQKYTYLLKGREDLRLDARIMQLLQAINSFLNSCADTRSRPLGIRYYSVTPITGQAGLIQWVDNVTSIYSVYKSWQIRTQRAQLAASGAGNSVSSVPPVPRPSDMFYGKIIPALKEKGIRRVISRRDWPHEVKRKVLVDLMKDTPKQLLWQEMWCASEGFRGFSSKTKRFSGSVAAMSIVGHILGLGDRHLDNILMDFLSGDVIHIDYNICFDKGKRLKIPEIVPFRLTQTIETALGLTGIEGSFRSNCEAVVDILRKNKDIVLMLLGVFLWDPLVEWTRGDNHDEAAIGGEEKKGMELAVSLSLFASRFQEIRIPLQEHHDLLVSALPSAVSALKRFLDVLNQYEVISATFYHSDKERSNLLQQETSAKSMVAEVKSASEKARASFEVQVHEFAQAKAVAAERSKEAAMWMDQHGRILDALRSGSIPDAQACIELSSMEEALSLISSVLVSGVPLTIVPEPTQAQCYDMDREVRHIIAELDDGISCAVEGLHEYAIALQRILPLNYITTSPVSSWAKVLQLSVNNLSTDILSLARRQAADLIAKAQGDGLDSVQQRHQDLFSKMERYAMEIEKVRKECSELMGSIGADTESKSKERLLSSFTRHIQSIGYSNKEDILAITQTSQDKHEGSKDPRAQGSHDEKKIRVLTVLRMAANELYKEVKIKVLNISDIAIGRIGWQTGEVGGLPDSGNSFRELEEQIEKCLLVAGFVNEAQELVGVDLSNLNVFGDNAMHVKEGAWASIFQASLHSCKNLIEQMTEVLPEIIRSIIAYNSDVMEAFGSLSQIRGSIDTALENLVEVELERASLMELEKNYFAKVGLITEQQQALEEAAAKGREHLSWEEAEELATQEEACREELDHLHQAWNKKDVRKTSLTKIESNIKTSLISSEQYFSTLIRNEGDGELPIRRSKALLSALVKPFAELELVDRMLSSWVSLPSCINESSLSLSDVITSGSQVSECLWGPTSILKDHTFFIWKVGILDTILDACIHDISSSVDHNFGFDHIYNDLKKKLRIHLQEYVVQYLKSRIAPALLAQLEEENENLQKMIEVRRDLFSDQIKKDSGATRRVQLMLEEYCNVHETARAARSAISVMERQESELTGVLCKTLLEIIQMEWLHDTSLPHLLETKLLPQNIICDDKVSSLVLNISRPKLLKKIQSSMSSIGRSLECLQSCERTSLSAEGQLERAMGWACGGPNTVGMGNSSVKSSGIPSEFHDHLMRRRQILWTAREQASDIIKICTSVMEFEASRDGLFRMPREQTSARPSGDGRAWQQAYLNALTRLDVAYHSFTRAEQEWKLAQNNMEAASTALFSSTNELNVASAKAKSASGDLQDSLAAMRDCAYGASIALSAYNRVSKGHTALTSECGSMLEEVLAIAEGLHDVYSLGKEAASVHSALMEDLSKANMILLPLEASLSTDVAAIADAIPKERESNTDVPPIHGQALHKSYCQRLREASLALTPLVPSVIFSVKELHSMLTKLARSSSMHAGNLHKALEGLGDSQLVNSQHLSFSRSKFSNEILFEDKEKSFMRDNGGSNNELTPADEFCFQDEGWISPPEHTYTSSPDSGITSVEASLSETCDMVEKLHHNSNSGDCQRHLSITNADGLESVHVEKSESEFVIDEVYPNSYAIPVSSDQSESTQALPLLHEGTVVWNDGEVAVGRETSKEAEISSSKNDICSSKVDKGHGGSHDEPSYFDTARRITKGKNAYALSVLRRVEVKVDGREIESSRFSNTSEQVDYLLKQATSIDNLCNMYEGWTPWI